MSDPIPPPAEGDLTGEAGHTTPSTSLSDVVARALLAYEALADLGETVESEWQYVTDLRSVYGAELRGFSSTGSERPVQLQVVQAVDAAIDEIALIDDPHRAIDWLSTFPQIVRIAIASEVPG